MNIDRDAALFVMLGQTADRAVNRLDDVVPSESLYLSPAYDLATVLPEEYEALLKHLKPTNFCLFSKSIFVS